MTEYLGTPLRIVRTDMSKDETCEHDEAHMLSVTSVDITSGGVGGTAPSVFKCFQQFKVFIFTWYSTVLL